MPLIEELPISQSHRVTHGWAYIPDTGPAPIAAIQPGNRKRARDTTTFHAAATAKQQKALQARLDSLDKENYKDGVSVPVPPRSGMEKKRDRKMTPNVRRILTYQRGFAHYLADEEAGVNVGTGPAQAQGHGHGGAGRGEGRRKGLANTNAGTNTHTQANGPETPASTATPTPTPARRGRPPANKGKEKMQPPPTPAIKQELRGTDKDGDSAMTDAPAIITPSTSSSTTTRSQPNQPTSTPKPPPTRPPTPPLLQTRSLPKMPTARVMSILTGEAPLSYAAARAQYPTDDEHTPKPARRFCGVCGYWGKVKCRACSEWTCGSLECWKGHGAVCVAGGY